MFESHYAMLAAQRAENRRRREYIAVLSRPWGNTRADMRWSECFADEWRVRFIRQRVDELLASQACTVPQDAVECAYREYAELVRLRNPREEFGCLAERD